MVISDLHGSLQAYEKLLQKAGYTPGTDQLILLGDLMEKGTENMALLEKIMEQCKNENVIALMGNCDFVAKNVLYAYRLEYLRKVLLLRKHSLIHEMIEKLGLPPLDQNTDMDQLAAALRKHFLPELSFLNDLPHALVTPTKIYVHAGLNNETTIADDFRDIMVQFHFGERDVRFAKTVIVGHTPVSEYARRIARFDPLIDHTRNIISIDGGMGVKTCGQLNALVFSGPMTWSTSVDLLPEAIAKATTRPKNPIPFYLNWANSNLDILEQNDRFSYVRSTWLNRKFWIDNIFLQDGKGTNFTNYEMPLQKGQKVKVAFRYGDKVQIKAHNQLGWTDAANLEFLN